MKKVIFLLLISVCLFTGCSIKKTNELTDAEIFAAEYSIGKDNVFAYATIDDVFSIFDGGTGIVFFGNSDQENCTSIVKLFSDLVEETDISRVYYYNPTVIRDDKTLEYDNLLSLMGDNLSLTEEGDSYLSIPSVYFVKDGVIIGYNDDASKIMEIDDEEIDDFKEALKLSYLELIEEYNIESIE